MVCYVCCLATQIIEATTTANRPSTTYV